MNKPDDGGPYHAVGDSMDGDGSVIYGSPGASTRLVLAAQFAAAWLPITHAAAAHTYDGGRLLESSINAANELGLAQADDLLRRLKEAQT